MSSQDGEDRGTLFGMVPRVVLIDRSIGYAAKCLYGILATYANTTGACWPSRETLMADMGVKEGRTIRAGLKELEDAGYIEREQRFAENGVQLGSIFRLCVSFTRTQRNIGGAKNSTYPETETPPTRSQKLRREAESEHPPEHTIEEHTIKTPPRPSGASPQGGIRRQPGLLDEIDLPGIEPDEIIAPAQTGKSAKPSRRQPKRPLPEGWCVTEELYAYAADQGFGTVDTDRIAGDFTTWCQANGAVYCDWTAAFQGWLRRERSRRPMGTGAGQGFGGPNRDGGFGPPSAARAAAAAVHAYHAGANRY